MHAYRIAVTIKVTADTAANPTAAGGMLVGLQRESLKLEIQLVNVGQEINLHLATLSCFSAL